MSNEELLQRLRSEIRSIEQGETPLQRRDAETVNATNAGSGKRANRCQGDAPRDTIEQKSAFSKIVALVNVSDRSEKAIRSRLAREEFDPHEIDEAVERAKGYGFIDDARYGELLVRSRISQGKGSAGIERELRGEGIDVDGVPGWPYEFPVSHEEELDRALALLDKKPPRSKNLREGAYRKLVGKGYPTSVASSAARIWSEAASS